MKVADLLESRRTQWRELEQLCDQTNHWLRKRMPAADVLRFSALYRAACADLALADAYQLPPATIEYLHQLVGRAHNQLYRGEALTFRGWFRELFVAVPRRLRADRCLWLAAGVFWGLFLLTAVLAFVTPEFAERVLSKDLMMRLEDMYSKPVERSLVEGGTEGSAMGGFYIFNNCSIGLQCFAFGLFLGIGGLYETILNAIILGTVFGFMAKSPHADNFFQFVTAHGPFELTAVVLCAAAGMRLGFSLVWTHGRTRIASLRLAGKESMSTVWTALVLFVLAAGIEGFVSPSSLPYVVKAAVAILSCVLLAVYFFVLGREKR
ncbi:MAG: stage II sporulation protein M [Thermoguttaceae bacterium]